MKKSNLLARMPSEPSARQLWKTRAKTNASKQRKRFLPMLDGEKKTLQCEKTVGICVAKCYEFSEVGLQMQTPEA